MSRLANPKEERENTGGAAASTSNDSAPKEKKGGLGRDKASRKFANATQEEREAANSDGKFGYYDMTNKRYVPAFFDMFDGGGQDTRGDKFKGGPLSNLLNRLGVDPYGSQRERMFVAPNTSSAIQAAVQGGSGGGANRPMLRPDNFMTEAQKEQVVMNQPVGNGYPDMSMPAIEGYTTPKPAGADYPNMNMPAIAGYTTPFTNQMTQPSALSGGTVQPIPAASQGVDFDAPDTRAYQMNNAYFYSRKDVGEDLNEARGMPNPAAFSANAPSAAAMTAPTPSPADRNPQLAAFNQAMSTVPAMLKGTQIEDMYRDHLLNGGGGTFAQFTGAQ